MWQSRKQLDTLQRIALGIMGAMVLLTFVGTNLQAVLWQSSEWLVSTVLPAVVVELTNDERASNNAAPLQRNAVLDAAAKLKAEHMAENEYFAHYSPEGVTPWHWFETAGYVYAHAGENLAIHFTDSEQVVEAWMNSPTHRKNIVDQKFTEIGVGTAKGTFEGYDTVYVVQLFGAPAVPSAPEPELEPTPEPAPIVTSAPEPTAQITPVPESESVSSPAVLAEETPTATRDTVSQPLTQSTTEPVSVVVPTAPAATPASTTPSITVVANADSGADPVVATPTTPATQNEVTAIPPREVVLLESSLVATSSGLPVASVTKEAPHAGFTYASIATQPNRLLEVMYMILGVMALMLISTSIFIEARRLQYRQVTYGIVMLFVMSGLWLFHAWLTSGAVIV